MKQEKASTDLYWHKIEMNKEDFVKLEELLYHQHRISLRSYRANYVQRRIFSRIYSLHLSSLSEYLAFLDRHPEEGEKLKKALSISVTSFFRDPETFQVLFREVIPDLLKFGRKNQGELRVWSAGCCTGEEPYSLAITFLETDAKVMEKIGLQIWATDFDRWAIQCGERGFYRKEQLSHLPSSLLGKYFREETEGYRIQPWVKKLVRFRCENLLADSFGGFEGLDLIMCRNLLIYLEKQEQMRLLWNFERALRKGGYLVLGKTEFLLEPFRSRFEPISVSERIYQKLDLGRALGQAGGR